MIRVLHYSRRRPAKFWHRLVIFLQALFAPGYAFVLTSKGVGYLYSWDDKTLAPATITHEAEHVRQSVDVGDICFRLRWVLSRKARLTYEAEGYSHQQSTPKRVLEVIRERASVYWLGTITAADEALILETAAATQKRGAPEYTYKDRR